MGLLLESSKRWSYVTQDKSRFGGKGVSKAVENINTIISDVLCGMDPSNIYAIDQAMIDARMEPKINPDWVLTQFWQFPSHVQDQQQTLWSFHYIVFLAV